MNGGQAPSRGTILLIMAIFAFLLFFQMPYSYLLEPDEARYAEIPREMLTTGNWLVPKLNYVDYFEKPPLLYWANAISLRVLGENSFAARLPTRLAALGVVLVLFFGLRGVWGDVTALLSGLIFLSAPLDFALGRTNTTDMLLTLAMTLALVALYRFLRGHERGEPVSRWAILTGVGCGLAVMTKGLIGIVLPGGALLLWSLFTRRWRRIPQIIFSWAAPVCLVLTVPYFVAVEKAAPGFSRFFWIHEHFSRFVTAEAGRPGPLYYFAGIFLGGFLLWTFFVPRIVRRFIGRSSGAARADFLSRSADLWFGLYALVIFVFFSISHSKLPPYILPMFPAVAVLAARALVESESSEPVRRPLFWHAIFWTVAAPVGVAIGIRGGDIPRYGLTALSVVAGAALVVFAWGGFVAARRQGLQAVLLALCGWIIFYGVLAYGFPKITPDQSAHDLAVAARRASAGGAEVVCYRTYQQAFPWILRERVPIYGWKGELEFGSGRGNSAGWFLPRAQFLKDWDSGRQMVALLRKRDKGDLLGHAGHLVAENRKYMVMRNF